LSVHDGADPTVWLNDWLTEPLALVAVIVQENEPAPLGVPVTAPVEELSDRPVGKAPEEILYVGAGLPLASTPSE
jgi:hypothetical protein